MTLRPVRRIAGAALAAALVASAVAASGAEAASAGAGPGCRTVHVGPARSAAVAHASYFQLRVRPGDTVSQAMVVANPRRYPCRVTLLPAYGQTAQNTGNTYPTARHRARCVETSCWLSGLPVTVQVPARSRRTVPFHVSVPAATGPGQYLAGVVAEPAMPPATVRRVRNGVGAAVVARVAIGVAVTVPGPLKPRIEIPSVRLDTSVVPPVLRIAVRNPGTTWEHLEGGARIRTDRATRSFGVRSSTVLPRDSATLSLPVDRVARGSHPTEVVLWYDEHRRKAVWRGTIEFPTPAQTADRPSEDGHVVIVAPGLPTWVKIVIAALGALVALLALLLLVVFRRRRRDDDDGDGFVHDPAPLVTPGAVGGWPR